MGTTSALTSARTGREILEWARDLISPELRSAVARLPSPIRKITEYHFAWSDERGRPTSGSVGKSVRPALTLLFAQAVGGDAEEAVAAGVAVELVHNFSLVHDDVMDGDTLRRHRPTAWSVFGKSQAILAGDALLTLALQVLAERDPLTSSGAIGELTSSLLKLVEGQSSDVAFEGRTDVALEDCIAMASGKTGALIGCACMLGALSGRATADQAESARQYGAHLGLAFQLIDDLLGIWGDSAITGKPVFADLQSRKNSLPVVYAMKSGSPLAAELSAFYRRPEPLDENDLARTADLIEKTGGRDWCELESRRHLEAAAKCLEIIDPDPITQAELESVGHTVIERDH